MAECRNQHGEAENSIDPPPPLKLRLHGFKNDVMKKAEIINDTFFQ